MSDIRFNQWLHQSGTGGVSQVDGGHVGIGTTNPLIPVGSGNTAVLNVGVVTANTFYGDGSNLSGIQVGGASSLSLNDHIGAYFGNSQDLKIYHDGFHSYIDDQGTGNVRIRSGTVEITNLAGSKTSAIFSSGGGQTLNFNNSTKFVTTNTGAVVTGILTATSDISIPNDTGKIKVGTHEDIEIYNKGNLSIIANKASGASSNNNPLHIYSFFDVTHGSAFSQYFRVGNTTGQESAGAGSPALNLISAGAVEAFFNGTKRFETTNTGAVVTGVLTATSFSGDGSSLSNLPAGAPVGGASTNTVFFENDKLVEVNYQITSTKNAMSAGPLSISAGVAVTVPSGCSWTIV